MKVRLPSLSPTASPVWRKKAPVAGQPQQLDQEDQVDASALILQLAVERLARLAAAEEEMRDGADAVPFSPGQCLRGAWARDDGSDDEAREPAANVMHPKMPIAIQKFIRRVAEKKDGRTDRGDVASPTFVATKHFDELKREEGDGIEAAREGASRKEKSMEPLPLDHFVRVAEMERNAKAREKRELAESRMPEAVRHFTKTAEVYRELQKREKAEVIAESKREEVMPVAVQKFTLLSREEKARKRAAKEESRRRVPPVPVGVAHFTPQTKAQELSCVLVGGANAASSLC